MNTINYPTVLEAKRGVLQSGTTMNLVNTPDSQGCSLTIKVAPLRIILKGRGNFDKNGHSVRCLFLRGVSN